jgi:putative glutamine transport system substrate-binding protein
MSGRGFNRRSGILLGVLIGLVMAFSPIITNAQTLQGDTWAEVQESGSGKIIVTYINTPAFIYEVDGELKGICIDIMKSFVNYVEKTYDVKLEVEYVDGVKFENYFKSMTTAKGGVFGLANTTITEQRKDIVDFSPPFITNIAVLLTHESIGDLTSLEAMSQNFAGMKAFAPSGSMHLERIKDLKEKYYPELEIELVPSSKNGLDRITEGEKAFSYQDIAIFWNYKENGFPIKRHPVGDKTSEKFGIVMPKGSDWTPLMEELFLMGRGFKSTNIYRSSLVEHLGPEVLQMLKMTSQN